MISTLVKVTTKFTSDLVIAWVFLIKTDLNNLSFIYLTISSCQPTLYSVSVDLMINPMQIMSFPKFEITISVSVNQLKNVAISKSLLL